MRRGVVGPRREPVRAQRNTKRPRKPLLAAPPPSSSRIASFLVRSDPRSSRVQERGEGERRTIDVERAAGPGSGRREISMYVLREASLASSTSEAPFFSRWRSGSSRMGRARERVLVDAISLHVPPSWCPSSSAALALCSVVERFRASASLCFRFLGKGRRGTDRRSRSFVSCFYFFRRCLDVHVSPRTRRGRRMDRTLGNDRVDDPEPDWNATWCFSPRGSMTNVERRRNFDDVHRGYPKSSSISSYGAPCD